MNSLERLNESAQDNLMGRLRSEFMPRETLNITFNHIETKLKVIEDTVRSLPKQLAEEFNDRFGCRLDDLEHQVDQLNQLKWKMAGVLLVLQGLMALAVDLYVKH